MFSKDKSNGGGGLTPERITGSSATLISAGTVLQGDLASESDLRIDGTIQGNVNSNAKIIVGPTGAVEGNIQGTQADVSGKVVGNINVKDLAQLRAKCSVKGNIAAVNLQIEAGALFNGQCTMTAAPVVLEKEKEKPKNGTAIKEGELLHAKAN